MTTVPTEKSRLLRAKRKAAIIRAFLLNKGIDLKHSHCLELISHLEGFKDWNTYAAYLKSRAI